MTPPFRVLVVGGAGVFGSRLVDAMLASSDWLVTVAGRDAERTRAFAAGRGGRVNAFVLDARQCSAEDLAATRAAVVVDAAGPFQGASYALALASVEAGLPYVDIADGRDFVAGFVAMVDGVARRRGVAAVTGASSTPALSNAALDDITFGWQRLDDILVAILPGNRAPRGLSVIRAILSYVGQPIPVFLGGRWTQAPGWGLTRRLSVRGLGARWASLYETPDLDVLPARHAVTGSAVFLAGLELSMLHLGLVAGGVLVRRRMVRGLAPIAPLARRFAMVFERFGTDRGGMVVRARGIGADGRAAGMQWSLVAEAGEGPAIPVLPALALLRLIAAGAGPGPGAHVCAGMLSLDQIEAEFNGRAISTTRTPSA